MRAFSYLVATALIAAAVSMPSMRAAFAQAGSTGGTIGNRDKSISGGGEERSERPAARKPAAQRASPSPRRERATTSASFDGNWAGVSVGPCIGQFAWKVQVSGGVISGGATGQISSRGATRGDMTVLGKHFLFTGVTRASGNASGTWTSSPTCRGTWTAVRS